MKCQHCFAEFEAYHNWAVLCHDCIEGFHAARSALYGRHDTELDALWTEWSSPAKNPATGQPGGKGGIVEAKP
jgi:hypothetical protein